ncbi:MAG: hypothetical protein HOK41_03830 [Nitrospina sp.]|jgi:hypothetical protein|nr:hypothetical protein [Nitrospina sp.]MBT6716293.1 hypothetical protein [Nitrospina sp.]
MKRKLNIDLEEEIFEQLKVLCKGDENAMKAYIIQALKNHVKQDKSPNVPEEKESLENYLNQGQSGSRNYGVKGQGW